MGRIDDRATKPSRGPKDMLRWKVVDTLSGKRREGGGSFETARGANEGEALQPGESSLTWIGHATIALRLGKTVIATDPIWSNRVAGTVPRLVPPGVAFEKMPPIEVVTISHAH